MEVDGQPINTLPATGVPIAPVTIHTYRERINSLPTDTGKQSPMDRLGSRIEKLAEFIEGKKNVHHEIRKLVGSIATAYRLASEAPMIRVSSTQTSPFVTPERKLQDRDGSKVAMNTGTVADGDPVAEDKQKSRSRTGKRKQRNSPDPIDTQVKKKKDLNPSPLKAVAKQGAGKKEENEWEKVRSRKERRKQFKEQLPTQPEIKPRPEPKRKKPRKWIRPDALIIRPKENVKYSDVLTRIKAAVPKDQVCNVDKIRKTAAGNMLITLSKKSTDKGQALKKTIAGVLLEDAAVISKGPQEELEIRDLDDITTKDDIRTALQEAAGDDTEIPTNAVKIRSAFSGTQTAWVTLPVAAAQKIIGDKGKIRIGLVNCRVRAVKRPRPCYKCWHYGHVAAQCKSGKDRSKLCIKCGQLDHQAVTCPNKAKCLLCAEEPNSKDTAHQAGSSRCAAFQVALKKITDKRA